MTASSVSGRPVGGAGASEGEQNRADRSRGCAAGLSLALGRNCDSDSARIATRVNQIVRSIDRSGAKEKVLPGDSHAPLIHTCTGRIPSLECRGMFRCAYTSPRPTVCVYICQCVLGVRIGGAPKRPLTHSNGCGWIRMADRLACHHPAPVREFPHTQTGQRVGGAARWVGFLACERILRGPAAPPEPKPL